MWFGVVWMGLEWFKWGFWDWIWFGWVEWDGILIRCGICAECALTAPHGYPSFSILHGILTTTFRIYIVAFSIEYIPYRIPYGLFRIDYIEGEIRRECLRYMCPYPYPNPVPTPSEKVRFSGAFVPSRARPLSYNIPHPTTHV
jgi:hypothetical protein